MPEGEKYTVVGGRGVIVREAPAMDSYVVGELRKGTTVWIDGGRAIDGGAYRAHMVAPLEGYVTLKATLLERCPEAPAVAQRLELSPDEKLHLSKKKIREIREHP